MMYNMYLLLRTIQGGGTEEARRSYASKTKDARRRTHSPAKQVPIHQGRSKLPASLKPRLVFNSD